MKEWVLTTSELNEYVRKQLAGDPLLRSLKVRGELTGFKRHFSGHLYFQLKDDKARVQCVMFRQYAQALDFEPRDGMQVTLVGSASLYPATGSFQVYCEQMTALGAGELYLKFEALKAKLSREGLFDAARKRPIPMLPRVVGLVTSRSGAALRDMVRVITRRYPGMRILLCAAQVQGAGAQVLSSFDEHLDEGGSQVELTAQSSGSAEVVLKLMGLPIKTVNVTVAPEKRVAPGGQSIGIALNMDGVLVVGASDVGVQPSPARMAGLRSGDLIVKVNGARIDSADQLSRQIARGNEAALEVMRAGKAVNVSIDPVKDERDGAYRLGAWVRDSTAGVGTLSFYDPETNCLAALGHAITDADTGTILTVSTGDIYESRVIGVMKGLEGEPGELLGDFIRDKAHMGAVSVNSVYGIYGKS
ncbi:MAG: exodeoxyribonuclease VII large subunit, partial [Clostridia bacterium]